MLSKMKSIKKLKLHILTSNSHNGLDWIHSLFDNHKDVLIMPAISLMRTITKYEIDIDNLSYKKIVKIFSYIFYRIPGYQVQRRKFICSKKQQINFEIFFLQYLKQDDEPNLIKKIFYGIHYSYAKLYKIDINKKKIIIAQEHLSFHCEMYEELFSPKFMFVIRDFRAAFSGSLKAGTKINNGLKTYANQFDKILINWILGTKFINYLRKKNKKKYYFIMNEKFNLDLKKNMKRISAWLNISYQSSSLKQTFLGQDWYGESSYLVDGSKGTTDLNEYAPKNFYNIKNVNERWRSFLTSKEIKLFNTFFSRELYNFGYIKNKDNIVKYFLSFLKINFIYLKQKTYFFNKYLIISRNIVRRFFIIYFPRLSIKLFKIY